MNPSKPFTKGVFSKFDAAVKDCFNTATEEMSDYPGLLPAQALGIPCLFKVGRWTVRDGEWSQEAWYRNPDGSISIRRFCPIKILFTDSTGKLRLCG